MFFSSLQIMMFYRPQPQPDVDGTDGLVELVAPQPQPDVVILVGAADPQQLEPVCSDATDGALMDCAATRSVTTNCPVSPPTIASYVPGISLETEKINFWVSLAGIAI
jgi:hypothetical protein